MAARRSAAVGGRTGAQRALAAHVALLRFATMAFSLSQFSQSKWTRPARDLPEFDSGWAAAGVEGVQLQLLCPPKP